jgi:hypothetical protein
VTNRKRTWSLVAIGVAGTLGVGTAVGISSANASVTKDSAKHSITAPAPKHTEQSNAGHMDAMRRETQQQAELKARKAKVIKAVLIAFPHAKILTVMPHKDNTWLVTLVVKDHRVGTVTVDRRFHVGPFKKLSETHVTVRPSDTKSRPSDMKSQPSQPSQTNSGDNAQSGHHW